MPVPELGEEYSYREVANLYNPTPVGIHFVLVRDDDIVALRFREDFNPEFVSRVPQLWVGQTARQRRWGNALADRASARSQSPLPAFMKRRGQRKYRYLGDYITLARVATEAEIERARSNVPHGYGVSRVVFLKRA